MAAAEQLTILADVKAWLKIDPSKVDYDAVLTALIDSASTFIFNEMNLPRITAASYTEQHDGQGGFTLFPRHRPITGVTSLVIGLTTVPASNGITAGYVFSDNLIKLIGYCFTQGFSNVALTYTAGLGAIPTDLAQVAKELVGLKFKGREHIGEQTKHLATQTVTFTTKDVTPWMQSVLDNYATQCP